MSCSRALLDRLSLAACLRLARASAPGEVPVGALVRCGATSRVLARASNAARGGNPLGHAEVLALAAAARAQAAPRLDGCTLYVTLEPCLMCLGAAVVSRVARIVFAARSTKYGAFSAGGLALDSGGGSGGGANAAAAAAAAAVDGATCAACAGARAPPAWLRASPVRMQVQCAEDTPLLAGAAAESAALLAGFFGELRREKLGGGAAQREPP